MADIQLGRGYGPPGHQPNQETIEDQDLLGQRSSWIRQVFTRLLSNPSTLTGLALLATVILLAASASLTSRYSPDAVDVSILNQLPSGSHWFGTDYLGRDMWARVVYGGRISLTAAFFVAAIGIGTGTPLGLIAGYSHRLVDDVIMRMIDVMLSIPSILLAIGVVSILGPSLRSAVIAVGITSIPGFARLARASTLKARELEYVDAARALGAGAMRILTRHILPNIAGELVVLATLVVGYAILATAALSFLGLGSQPPASDWGTLLSKGYDHMFQSWSQVVFPGLAIVMTVLGINLFGDGLNDALSPRSRGYR